MQHTYGFAGCSVAPHGPGNAHFARGIDHDHGVYLCLEVCLVDEGGLHAHQAVASLCLCLRPLPEILAHTGMDDAVDLTCVVGVTEDVGSEQGLIQPVVLIGTVAQQGGQLGAYAEVIAHQALGCVVGLVDGYAHYLQQTGDDALAAELVNEGSLVLIGDYSAYSRPGALKEFVAKIRAKKLNTSGTDDFVYYIEDDKGREFSLVTKFALLPGDEAKVKANYDSGKAYVFELVTKRAAVIGRIQQLKKNHIELIPDEPNLGFIRFVFESPEAVI